MSNSPTRPRITGHRVKKIVAASVGHLLVSTFLFIVFVAAFMTEQAYALMGIVMRDAALQSEVFTSLLIMYGLSACTWALMFIMFLLGRENVKASRRPNLQRARGTVITETLIILPIFFLLTFGLAQMALNSIAGLLTTLGTFQATRTAAVWGPEINNGRANISQALAEEKVRLAAATVIAPAVPNLQSGAQNCAFGQTLPRFLEGMGGYSGSPVANVAPGNIEAQPQVWSFIEGLGTSTFAQRGPAQVTLAYCNIDVSWTPTINNDPKNTTYTEFTLTLQYHHPAVMPLVGPVFANNPGAGKWETDYTATMERQYMMSSYLTPLDCGPLGVMWPWSGDCD